MEKINLIKLLKFTVELIGYFVIVKIVVNFIRKVFLGESIYDDITIIGNPSEEDKNRYHSIMEYCDSENPGEYTLLAPTNSDIKNIRIYELISKKGKLKKGKVLKKYRKLEPNKALLLNIYCNCGMPIRMLVWKSKDYSTAKYYFSENGFNGNRTTQVVKYESGLFTWIVSLFN